MSSFVLRFFTGMAAFAIAGWTAMGFAQVTLPGSTPDEASEIASAPSLARSRVLHMRVVLGIHNRAGLEKLIAEQQDPSSPNYHRWLTPDQFADQFGPSEADVQHVARWLQDQGFIIVSRDTRDRTISFVGDVGHAASTFGVRLASDDGVTFSNTNDPAVPADIAPLIESINGLSNLVHTIPAATLSAGHRSREVKVNGQGPAFGPPDVYTFYDERSVLLSGIDGTGTDCLGLIEESNFDTPSTAAFNTEFSLPPFTGLNLSAVLVDGSDPGINNGEVETLVDIEWSHAAAPGASIVVYLGDPANTKSGSALIDAITSAVTDNTCGALAITFALCGVPAKVYQTLDTLFAQAASQGQAVFEASGDQGSAGVKFDKKQNKCVPAKTATPNEIAGSPHLTGVGGTQFTASFDGSGDDIGSATESVWKDAVGASGGGRSKIFKKPTFQGGGLTPEDSRRDIPDVAFGASPTLPGFFLGVGGTVTCCVGGTSLGSPYWAGISELLSQKVAGRVGNLNIGLYSIGPAGVSSGLTDVTSGNNSFNGVKGFKAVKGYDRATGWGTPDIANLLKAFP